MDSYEEMLAAVDAREHAEALSKRKELQRCTDAAKVAHDVRRTNALVLGDASRNVAWEDLSERSQRLLIEEAKNVALNPSISAAELARLYRERLMADGEVDHEDLGVWSAETEVIEAAVLASLKASLASS